MSYHGLAGPVDDLAQEVASYAGNLIEQQMVQRTPLILDELRPQIRESAKDAMKYAFQDQQFREAMGQTQTNLLWYGLAGAVGVSLLTWALVKYA
jgi:hypothetical protein